MMNTEGNEPTNTAAEQVSPFVPDGEGGIEYAETDPAAPTYVDTVATMDGHWDQPEMAYRYLNWVKDQAAEAFSVNLEAFSVARQEGVADLVRNGLVSERKYVGGADDGRWTYRLTDLGEARLMGARALAAAFVTKS